MPLIEQKFNTKRPKKYIALHGIEIKFACMLLDDVKSKIQSRDAACPFHVGHSWTGYESRWLKIKSQIFWIDVYVVF